MKRFIIIAAVLVCLAQSQLIQQCPQLNCSKDKAVCGVKVVNGQQEKKTYQNQCEACTKSDFTIEGECSDYPADAQFCSPSDQKGIGCPYIFEPSCGWFSEKVECYFKPCAISLGTRCGACRLRNVIYTTKGLCPRNRL